LTPARNAAYRILYDVFSNCAYSNIAIDEYLQKNNLDNRDSALAVALVNTVIERKITLEYNLKLYLSQPIKKLNPTVYIALMLGSAQILFFDKIPDSAAVNESVELVRKNKCQFAAGLVNAVLRKISAAGLILPTENADEYLSVKYSFPLDFVDMLIERFGRESAISFMENTLENTAIICRLNTLKTDSKGLCDALEKDDARVTFFDEKAFILESEKALNNVSAFNDGLFFVQDISSQKCADILDAKAGETVLDVCAAPGGKSFSIAINMNNEGIVYSCDIHEHKLRLIENMAERLGISIIKTELADGTDKAVTHPECDRVLCDVPCSGLGVVGKKPEIKYKDFAEFEGLPKIQYSILQNASRFVRADGVLVYSTCTIRREENEEIVEKFIKNNDKFMLEYEETLLPDKNGSDGFFIAKLICKDKND
jgi:16S rRNA (cytosine967-C5)-methyltransferase